MKYDPFTLRVALNAAGDAHGELYLDDGVTFSHQDGQFIWREFVATSDKKARGVRISSRNLAAQKPSEAVDGVALATYDIANSFVKEMLGVRVERVVVFGLASKPNKVQAGGRDLYCEFTPGVTASEKRQGTTSVLVVKDPDLSVTSDWEIVVQT